MEHSPYLGIWLAIILLWAASAGSHLLAAHHAEKLQRRIEALEFERNVLRETERRLH